MKIIYYIIGGILYTFKVLLFIIQFVLTLIVLMPFALISLLITIFITDFWVNYWHPFIDFLDNNNLLPIL